MRSYVRLAMILPVCFLMVIPGNTQAFFCPMPSISLDMGAWTDIVLEGNGFSRGNFTAMEFDTEHLEVSELFLEDKLEGVFSVRGLKPGKTTAVFHWEFTDKSDEGLCTVEFDFAAVGIDRMGMKARLSDYIDTKGYDEDALWAFAPQQPLAAGTMIGSGNGDVSVELDQSAWLAWIDLNKEERYGHPGDIVLIDEMSGEITAYDTRFWPTINGTPYLSDFSDRLTTPDLICGTVPEPTEVPSSNTVHTEDEPVTKDSVCAVLVSGSANNPRQVEAFATDVDFMKKNLMGEALGPRLSEENIAVMNNASREDIENTLKAMKGKYKKVYFFYSGHGTERYLVTNDEVGSRLWYADLIRALDESEADELCVVVDACHSGSAIEEFRNSSVLKDQSVELFTSCRGDTTSWTRYIVTGGGDTVRTGEYTWAFVQCFGEPNADVDKDGKTSFMEAHEWLLKQNVTLDVGGTIRERMDPQRYKHVAEPVQERQASFSEPGAGVELTEEPEPGVDLYGHLEYDYTQSNYSLDPKITHGDFSVSYNVLLLQLEDDTLKDAGVEYRVYMETSKRVKDTSASNQPAIGIADDLNSEWVIGPNIEFDAMQERVFSGPFSSSVRFNYAQQLVEPNSVHEEDRSYSDWVTVYQNYPNPIVGSGTSIPVQLQKPSSVTLSLQTIVGETVYTVTTGRLPEGTHVLEIPREVFAELSQQQIIYTVRAESRGETVVVSRMLLLSEQ